MQEIDRQKIDNYLLGRLEGAELEAFLLQLENNPKMAEELNIQKVLLEQIDALGDRKMKDKLLQIKQQVGQQQSQPGQQAKSRRLYIWAAAAAAVLLLLLAIPWNWSGQTNEQLYAQYYEAYPLPFASRDVGERADIAEAGRLYRGKQFQQLLPLLEELTAAQPEDARLQLAKGISLLELGQYQQAIASFQPIIDAEASLYPDQARWYTALAQLRLENIEAAKAQLQILSNTPQARFNKEASELLNELN